MKRQLVTLCLMMGLLAPASAATTSSGQIITINGQAVDKEAIELTFDGDNVVLHFSDGSSQSADMSTVSISFAQTTGIGDIKAFSLKGVTGDVLNIGGLVPGERVQIFDVSGKLVASGKANSDDLQLDLSGMKGGVYILRAGNNVVKFVKR